MDVKWKSIEFIAKLWHNMACAKMTMVGLMWLPIVSVAGCRSFEQEHNNLLKSDEPTTDEVKELRKLFRSSNSVSRKRGPSFDPKEHLEDFQTASGRKGAMCCCSFFPQMAHYYQLGWPLLQYAITLTEPECPPSFQSSLPKALKRDGRYGMSKI